MYHKQLFHSRCVTLPNAYHRLKAKELFEKTDAYMQKTALGGDGPSRTLLEYMKERNYVAPKDWKGYRPLTSK